MPLKAEDFDKVSNRKTNSKLGKNQMRIINLLKNDLDKAFTQGEIKKYLNAEHDAAVHSALHSLKIKGLITCKKVDGLIYWRGTDELLDDGSEDKKIDVAEKADDEDGYCEVDSEGVQD